MLDIFESIEAFCPPALLGGSVGAEGGLRMTIRENPDHALHQQLKIAELCGEASSGCSAPDTIWL